jgi:N-acetylneuraminate synthase
MKDVERAVDAIQKTNKELILMQCNTNYTAKKENFGYINLNVLRTYQEKYPELILGLSDHTKGYSTVLGAIALGARVIEKHFTDDVTRNGPDHHFSITPIEWKEMVTASNELFYALGDGVKRIEENEKQTVRMQRRSIYLAKDKKSGEIVHDDDFEMLRPYNENGFAPFELKDLLGKKCIKDLDKGSLLMRSDVE